ncbi:class I SAM-dependent methyltransferase [Streptomyces sp. CA-181903]|uniref:class I SAM-dependent methyltransferase n=1 Tax=Streptomyces sp. CA-181903 TaxID=3240055 RepID=UPI003D914FA4
MDHDRLAASYSDSNPFFRLLRHMGWGALVNLGYYTLPTLPALVSGVAFFQRQLETRSLTLLQARAGHRVLDACCGRGHTTARLGAAGCAALGVDISAQQIAQARRRYGGAPNTDFAVADVTSRPWWAPGFTVPEASFDRVHCLEAAFHFTPAGRRTFLTESFRALCPGAAWSWSTSPGSPRTRTRSDNSIRGAWYGPPGRSRASSRWHATGHTRSGPGSRSGARSTGPVRSSGTPCAWARC